MWSVRTLVATLTLTLVASCHRSTRVVFADFSEASGVKAGTPVLYRGIAVGEVKAITLERTKARVTIALTQADAPLRSSDQVEIVPVGMFGDVALKIVPTGDHGQPIAPGTVLQGVATPRPKVPRTEAVDSVASLLRRVVGAPGDSSHQLPRP